MFSLFGKKSGADVTDKVWMSTPAMQAGLGKWLQAQPNGIVAVWFQKDKEALQALLPEAVASRLILADQLTPDHVTGNLILFAGHYPLQQVEAELAEKIGMKKMLVHSSLTSPLFKHFGGDKIIEVAKGMGMKEDEAIEHFLVSSAITKTQGKIADKVSQEQFANSEEEWMQLNLG
jgi:iron only hydrogenase large subunit-like protein